jgi:hypothetical protein
VSDQVDLEDEQHDRQASGSHEHGHDPDLTAKVSQQRLEAGRQQVGPEINISNEHIVSMHEQIVT